MAEPLLLAIDVGTTNTKAALFNTAGTLLYSASRRHKVDSPQEGYAEHDAEKVWWGEVKAVCRELMDHPQVDPAAVASIGVSALSPALAPVDADGNALYPGMLYGLDRRAMKEIQELKEQFAAKMGENSAEGISPLSTGPKILWLKRHEPEIFEKAAYFVGVPSFVVMKLTGEMVADYGCYNIGGLPFSREKFDWDDEMCEACGITRDRLPKLKFGTELAGHVTPEAARETGLMAGTPVAVSTGDFPAESISYGTIYSPWIKLSFGTTVGVNFGSDHGMTLFPDYDYRHPKKHIRGGAMSNGCSTIDWTISMLSGVGDDVVRISDDVLQSMVDSVPAGSNGVVMLPYLNGEKTPFSDPEAKGVIFGLQSRHGQAEIYRASLEALAYSIRHNLQRAPEGAHDAVVLGGGTRIPGLMQIVSDVTGFTLTKLEMMNGSLVGDAFVAGMACGMYSTLSDIDPWVKTGGTVTPNPVNKVVYDEGFARYRKLYEMTAPLMRQEQNIE
ncbi:MAG: hypothetical protein LIP11_04960 [Clostridiales bacterium]|nr:hypothetical protein [Clostridiales bacterium]